MPKRVEKTDEEWRRDLSPDEYAVCRQQATEPAFQGRYWNSKQDGIYRCAGCGLELFDSEAKYDSGTGWPSFSEPIDAAHLRSAADDSAGMARTEVLCAACDSHLGHVFPDGPRPGGRRYCMNSLSLRLEERD